jgi:hypothetical protein
MDDPGRRWVIHRLPGLALETAGGEQRLAFVNGSAATT